MCISKKIEKQIFWISLLLALHPKYVFHGATSLECVDWKKHTQPKCWELCLSQRTLWGLQGWVTASRKYRQAVLKREEEEPGYIGVLATEDQIVWTSKDYCQLKKLRHIKWMTLVLFYVWEEARVWAHWNHSFHMYLSYVGPVSCPFSSPWYHHWGWMLQLTAR